jgi:hypothetical protein
MKLRLETFLRFKPILVGAALFSLMWIVMKELSVPYEELCCHVTPGLYYDQMFSSFLLVAASLALLLKRLWSHLVALYLSGLVFFESLFRDFWLLARSAEVPRFSYRHFSLWWPNLTEGQLLQIMLAGSILACSVTSVIRSARSRRKRTMSDKGLHPTANQLDSHR